MKRRFTLLGSVVALALSSTALASKSTIPTKQKNIISKSTITNSSHKISSNK